MKKYKAYIFDLYGTLIDIHTDEYGLSLWKKLKDDFLRYGAEYDPYELREKYFKKDKELRRKYSEKGHVVEIDIAEVYEHLLKLKGVIPDKRMIEDLAYKFRNYSRSHMRLYANVKEVLMTLRDSGAEVYLLSNAQYLYTYPELCELKLTECFDEIFISSVCHYMKPDPCFMEMLLKKHQLKPEECLMIGNDPRSDVLVARKSKVDSYYVHTGRDNKSDYEKVRAVYKQKGMDMKKLLRNLGYQI